MYIIMHFIIELSARHFIAPIFIPFGCILFISLSLQFFFFFLFMIKLLRYSNFLLRLNRVSRIIYANHVFLAYNMKYYVLRILSRDRKLYIAWKLGCIVREDIGTRIIGMFSRLHQSPAFNNNIVQCYINLKIVYNICFDIPLVLCSRFPVY